ncbi:MAG: hypothetical protein EBX95_07695 [Acidimicrobiia bacterium]|nr:hypothetical protein [Acidimicrobiia bacterium]
MASTRAIDSVVAPLGAEELVVSSSAPSGRVCAVARVLAIIESLAGLPDLETVLDDERLNLEAFLSEDNGPEGEAIKAKLKPFLAKVK